MTQADQQSSGASGYEGAAEADYSLRAYLRALDEERAIRLEEGIVWTDDGIEAECGEAIRELRANADKALAEDEIVGVDDGWWRR